MATGSYGARKIKLLQSDVVFTSHLVAEVLGIQTDSATKLLRSWERDELVTKTAQGCYINSLSKQNRKLLILKSLQQRFGKDIVLIGASSWEAVGWCDSGTLQVGVRHNVSRGASLAKTEDTTMYPLSKAHFDAVSQYLKVDTVLPISYLDPIAQMIWWLDMNCDVMMPAPHRIHWNIVNNDPDLVGAVKSRFPQMADLEAFSVEAIYMMVFMDRLDGTRPGVVEPVG